MKLTQFESVILAAGKGSRLGNLGQDKPKGLLTVAGETLVQRSVRQLRKCGSTRVTLVVGHMKHKYEEVFADAPHVRLVENPQYEETGSFDSLVRGLQGSSQDVLVLDSDIVYDTVGLQCILSSAHRDAVLASGLSHAGDEVWVFAENGQLTKLSKTAGSQSACVGEFVGISRISSSFSSYLLNVDPHGMKGFKYSEYEEVFSQVSGSWNIGIELVDNLRWGEVDTVSQLTRVQQIFRQDRRGHD